MLTYIDEYRTYALLHILDESPVGGGRVQNFSFAPSPKVPVLDSIYIKFNFLSIALSFVALATIVFEICRFFMFW